MSASLWGYVLFSCLLMTAHCSFVAQTCSAACAAFDNGCSVKKYDQNFAKVIIAVGGLMVNCSESAIEAGNCTVENESLGPTMPSTEAASAVFCAQVDMFAVMELSFLAPLMRDGAQVTVEVNAVKTQTSKTYRVGDKRVPFWTVIVNVNGGQVVSVYWDSFCTTCTASYCIDGNCAYSPSECGDAVTLSACDPKVYLAWTGTDKNNLPLVTEGETFSKYTAYSIFRIFNAATQAGWNLYDDAKAKALGYAQNAKDALQSRLLDPVTKFIATPTPSPSPAR